MIEEILKLDPFLPNKDKESFREYICALTQYHYKNCKEYKAILDALQYSFDNNYLNTPFLPIRLFKELSLKSTQNETKTLTSSGTSGKASQIFLDKENAKNQQNALIKTISNALHIKRSPMLIIDCKSTTSNKEKFNARAAGIFGFSIFGNDILYALDENNKPKLDEILCFLDKHKDKHILVFGFTFIIYLHFYKELKNANINLENSTLIHGGGWKKLESLNIQKDSFKEMLKERFSITKVIDYYGMAESAGSIFIECPCGYFHTSTYNDIIIRDENFNISPYNKEGFMQIISILPKSYPGHSILSEDMGIIYGEDDCPCGRYGKYFKLTRRMENSEIRGCSDTYELKNTKQ
ncbi:LuxE/PaaK family acyltransferase [Helicobacter ibis]|uniref:Acyl-protein synthetase n=1 Tax=Helicobacter ibis TaxID=2962633 RepID=A0ABT4VFL5_9HELI|nr:acyl-protein synthetase [Helicobacter ibis]MDA3968890.1 acyl-protein synthetase [Helicobacter ibis]